MNKRQPKAKTVASKSQPDQGQIVRHPHSATQPTFEVPLDILCDIAWRLSHSKGSGEIDMGQWCQNVLHAYDLIWAANNLRRDKGNQHTRFVETQLDSEARFRDRLTDIELGTDHVGFERACLGGRARPLPPPSDARLTSAASSGSIYPWKSSLPDADSGPTPGRAEED